MQVTFSSIISKQFGLVRKIIDQDVCLQKERIFCICDGHGEKGKEIASTVCKLIVENIEIDFEPTAESIAQLKHKLIGIFKEKMDEWKEIFPDGGTTILLVVFSSDFTKYGVVKMGDSYIMQVPKDFASNGSHLPFDSIEVRSNWVTSLSPLALCEEIKKYKLQFPENELKDVSSHGVYNCRWSRHHLGVHVYPLGFYFRTDAFNIATLGIEPAIYNKDTDCLDTYFNKFILTTIETVKMNHTTIIASDGLPIHKPTVWQHIFENNIQDFLQKEYWDAHKDTDDCSLFVIDCEK